MSFDYAFNFVFGIFDFFKKENKFELFINKKFIKKDNSVLKVILPPRGDGGEIVTKILIKRLNKKGYSILAYYFPKNILLPDTKETLKNFYSIQDQIRADISKLKMEHAFKQVDIIAPSLGVVSACLIANGNDDISNLFFIVPGSCLASSLWEGIRTRKLKNIYKKQNIDEEQLKNIWQKIAPKNNLDKMNNKNIFIVISKTDRIIPFRFGEELAISVQKLYPNNTIVQKNNYLGHYLTAIKYYLFSKQLLK